MGKSEMENGIMECTTCLESIKKVVFADSVLGKTFEQELREIDKHEIIVKIAEIIGESPSNIKKAEDIFELLKYSIANYIVLHEYGSAKGVDADFLLWLDSRTNPQFALQVSKFFSKYIE